jgi:hypothetical protein
MNDSLAEIYMDPAFPLDLPLLETLVRDGGFQLNRNHESIYLLDENGDGHPIDALSLAARLIAREDTQFQFWEKVWEGKYPGDLYCRVRFKSRAIIVEFGELPHDSHLFLQGIWRVAKCLLANQQIMGIVVDLVGDTQDYFDWQDFFIERRAYRGRRPDVLCFEKDLDDLLPTTCHGDPRIDLTYHTVICTKRLAPVLDQH